MSLGFTVAQVAQKQGWPDSMVWYLALEGKNDHDRFKEFGWGFRTWGQWEWNDCDNRFGDDWPGRIPAQLIAHILRYFRRRKAGRGDTRQGSWLARLMRSVRYEIYLTNVTQ